VQWTVISKITVQKAKYNRMSTTERNMIPVDYKNHLGLQNDLENNIGGKNSNVLFSKFSFCIQRIKV